LRFTAQILRFVIPGQGGLGIAQDLQSKCQPAPRVRFARRLTTGMQIVIMIGGAAMLALYAVIIVGCLRQPEW